MRKLLFALAAIMFVLVACDNYGKRVKINDSLEVYVKGDSVTENDAKKLGDYFAKLSADSQNDKSLQLSKDGGQYVVRMVVDENKVKADSSLDLSFMALKTLIETEVFEGQSVKFIVTDNRFNDLKSFQ